MSYAFVGIVFIDAAFGGMTIGAGYAASQRVGFALAVGLSIEMLFLCLSMVTATFHGSKMMAVSVGVAATLLVTAVLGYHFLNGASNNVIAVALTFSAAALVYLVTEELLIEAHKTTEARFAMLVLFAAFLLFWAVLGA